MADNSSANFPPLVSREQAENAFGDALRLFVGRGRRYSVKQLANATGVKDRAIECAMCPSGSVDFRPLHMGAQYSIQKFLGAVFTSEVIAIIDQVAFEKPDGIDHDEVEDAAREFLAAKGRAHHPDSPGGRELSDCEQSDLDMKVVAIMAKAA